MFLQYMAKKVANSSANASFPSQGNVCAMSQYKCAKISAMVSQGGFQDLPSNSQRAPEIAGVRLVGVNNRRPRCPRASNLPSLSALSHLQQHVPNQNQYTLSPSQFRSNQYTLVNTSNTKRGVAARPTPTPTPAGRSGKGWSC